MFLFKLIKALLSRKSISYEKDKKYKGPGLVDEIDVNDLELGKAVGEAIRADLTANDFKTRGDIISMIHQGWTDFCIACQQAYQAQKTEGKKMSWTGMMKLIMEIYGYLTKFGASILNGCKARQKFGIPEEEYDTFNDKKSRNFNADPKNLSKTALENAEKHKSQTYWRIYDQKGWDRFDLFRAYLNKLKDKGIMILTGIDAHAVGLDRQQTITESDQELIQAGLKVEVMYLVGPDSYGTKSKYYPTGKSINGWRYFTRRETNLLFNGYVELDIVRELAELLNAYNGKAVKGSGDKVYLIKDGKKCWIESEYVAWGVNIFLWHNLNNITDEELNKIPKGNDLTWDSIPQKRKDELSEMLNSTAVIEKLKGKLNVESQ